MTESEKGGWYRQWKFWAFVGYALIIVVICLCLFVSVQEVPIWSFVPDSSFAFISININEDAMSTTALLNRMELWMMESEVSRAKRFMIKRVFSSFLPERIIAIAVASGEAKPDFLLVVRMGGVIRLAKLFPGQIDRAFFGEEDFDEEKVRGHRVKYAAAARDGFGFGAYAIIEKTFVAGSGYTVLKDALTRYTSMNSKNMRPQHLTPIFLRSSDQHSFSVFADNSARDLSNITDYIEEKYAFAVFPSMDAVEMVYGSVVLEEEQVTGLITFLSNDAARLREVRSDVKYIYGAMRRKLKPSNISLKGDVQTRGSRVLFEFSVPDYIDAMINYLSEERGESE